MRNSLESLASVASNLSRTSTLRTSSSNVSPGGPFSPSSLLKRKLSVSDTDDYDDFRSTNNLSSTPFPLPSSLSCASPSKRKLKLSVDCSSTLSSSSSSSSTSSASSSVPSSFASQFPFSRLPDELLAEILEFSSFPIELAWVSQRWHSVWVASFHLFDNEDNSTFTKEEKNMADGEDCYSNLKPYLSTAEELINQEHAIYVLQDTSESQLYFENPSIGRILDFLETLITRYSRASTSLVKSTGKGRSKETLQQGLSQKLFELSAAKGRSILVSTFLSDPRVAPGGWDASNNAIRWASKKNRLEIVDVLLSSSLDSPSPPASLASPVGSPVSLLDEENREEEPLEQGKERGGLERYEVDPSQHDSEALRWAIERGYWEVVSRLLTDNRVDPSCCFDFPIRLACQLENSDIVELLLKDDRVDPSDLDNFCLRQALEKNNQRITLLLCEDDRLRLTPLLLNQILLKCFTKGWDDLLDLILRQHLSSSTSPFLNFSSSIFTHFSPLKLSDTLLQIPLLKGHHNILIILLNPLHRCIDSSSISLGLLRRILRTACESGWADVVRILLSNRRLDPSFGNNLCLKKATEFGKLQCVQLLLDHPKVNEKREQQQTQVLDDDEEDGEDDDDDDYGDSREDDSNEDEQEDGRVSL